MRVAIFVFYRMIDGGSGPGGEEAALKAVGRKACGFESCRFRHFLACGLGYLPDFRRLSSLQSIWQFLARYFECTTSPTHSDFMVESCSVQKF